MQLVAIIKTPESLDSLVVDETDTIKLQPRVKKNKKPKAKAGKKPKEKAAEKVKIERPKRKRGRPRKAESQEKCHTS